MGATRGSRGETASRSATIAALFAERLIAAAAAQGVDPRPLWRTIGVTADEIRSHPLSRIALTTHLTLWETVRRLTQDPAIALAYARSKSIDDYGLLGLACKTAPDVRGALVLLTSFAALYADNVSFALTATDLVVTSTGRKGQGLRCQLESAVAEIWQSTREIVGASRTIALENVTFTHAAPRDAAPYTTFFGRAPRFAAQETRMRFSEATLRTPLLRSDTALHRYLMGALADAARTSARAPSETERVRSAIFQLLPRPSRVGLVARSLGMSVRSLQRRLDAEGTSFDAVLDDSRMEIANAMLADPRTTLSEVAAATAFSEPSAFSRAYKRWTGKSPRRGHAPRRG